MPERSTIRTGQENVTRLPRPEGRASARLALALAKHLSLGRGVSAETIETLAKSSGVRLSSIPQPVDSSAGGLPQGSVNALTSHECGLCGRRLIHPVQIGLVTFGRVCARKVRWTNEVDVTIQKQKE